MSIKKVNQLLSSNKESNIVLGAKLAENVLGWSLTKTLYAIIKNIDHLEFMEEQNQEEVCKMCEDLILGCSSSSSTFLCEGCSCEEANEMFIENYFENLIA